MNIHFSGRRFYPTPAKEKRRKKDFHQIPPIKIAVSFFVTDDKE
jgi:hypothetical protein